MIIIIRAIQVLIFYLNAVKKPSVWEIDKFLCDNQSMEILNAVNTLTLKQLFRKTKTFFKKLE